MKYILIIGDGMADNAIPELGGKTPLQYAKNPTMDKLAGAGIISSVLTVPEGMPAGSDTAILSIFGSDPSLYYGGRASLEAAAVGIKLNPGDIAYRCNMITIEGGDKPFNEKKILSHSAGAVNGEVSDTLITDLFNSPVFCDAAEKAGISIYPGGSFRHIAVQKAKIETKTDVGIPFLQRGNSGNCYGTDRDEKKEILHQSLSSTGHLSSTLTPPHDHIGETLGQHLPKGNDNADILTDLIRLSHDILKKHPINIEKAKKGEMPANCIWFWAEGAATVLPDFKERYGKTGSVISAVPLCQGIGVLMGLEKITVNGATGELNTNYEGKADAAFESLKTHDFTAIHIEAPDECTHNGDLKGKLLAIEWIDSRIIAPLVQRFKENNIDYKMLIISDHKTLISTRGHSGEPVPYILYDSREDKKTGLHYCEQDAQKSGYTETGLKLMEMLFQ